MPSAEEFDEFYVAARRRLALQTFALTGDLAATRLAVRDAFVAARHHWAKVGALSDPEEWVRPRAWSIAQRRHLLRPWRRERLEDEAQAAVLHALHEVGEQARRALILQRLAGRDLGGIGRELGLPRERVEALAATGAAELSAALECPSSELTARLESLGSAVAGMRLPRPDSVRRHGARRRSRHAIGGALLAAAITVASGAFVATATPDPPPPRPRELVSHRMLLTPAQLSGLPGAGAWTAGSTTDNTEGDGLNTTCQQERFADDDGLGAWVRDFDRAGREPARLVQMVEISGGAAAAKTAYETTVGWYAGCAVPRIQLVDAFEVDGVGDEARILRMRIPDRRHRAYLIGVARTGSLTTSTVLQTRTGDPGPTRPLALVLADSVRDLCDSPVAGACVDRIDISDALPAPSGEQPGMLVVADLPPIASVRAEWVGTRASAARSNPAATLCDRADFATAGAKSPLTRSYLIPHGDLPQRFGLTETVGTFARPQAAAKFVARVEERMRRCPDRELGSTIKDRLLGGTRPGGVELSLWRLETQVNEREDLIAFWTAVVRDGSRVAQVTLTPVGEYDIDKAAFRDLATRARDRLADLP